MTDARLTSIAERIDRLEDERKETAGLIADVYKEAKGHGYNTKALRTVLAARRKPTDESLAADIEMYRALLGMPGATYRSVSERIGVSKTKLQRLVPRKENGTAHDPATGEVIESSGGVEGHAASRQGAADRMTAGSREGFESPEAHATAGVEPGPLDTPSTESSGQPVRGLDGDGPAASRPLDTEIDLTIPPALRRTRAA